MKKGESSFYRQCYLAITDFRFYRQILYQPPRRTLLFLLYLCAHLALFLTLFYAWHYFPEFETFFDWAGENFPPLTVEEGELHVEGNQPLVRKYQAGETWSFVFDTGGTYKTPQGLEGQVFLLTRENLIVRLEGQTQTYEWRDFGPFKVEPGDWPGIYLTLKWLYFPVGYGIALIIMLLSKLLQCLLLSPIALLVGVRYGIRLRFVQAGTIALYSLIPAIVIDIAVRLTGLEIDYFDLIYLAIAAIYTYLATQRCVLAD